MKRLSLMLAAFAVLCMAVSAQAKTFINGIDANYPPFAYVGEDGKPAGFDVESMDWIAKTMGFEVKHQPMDWDGIIPALMNKKIDMVCSGMSITPERAAVVNFSDPYFTIQKFTTAARSGVMDMPEQTMSIFLFMRAGMMPSQSIG